MRVTAAAMLLIGASAYNTKDQIANEIGAVESLMEVM